MQRCGEFCAVTLTARSVCFVFVAVVKNSGLIELLVAWHEAKVKSDLERKTKPKGVSLMRGGNR